MKKKSEIDNFCQLSSELWQEISKFLLRVIFDHSPKYCLGYDVETEIRILKVIQQLRTVMRIEQLKIQNPSLIINGPVYYSTVS